MFLFVSMALFAHQARMHPLLAAGAFEHCIALPLIRLRAGHSVARTYVGRWSLRLRVGGTVRCGRMAPCSTAFLAIFASPRLEANLARGRSSLRPAVDAAGTIRTTARRVSVLEAIVLALNQRIVLDCVRRPRHAARVAVMSGALREEALVTAPLVFRTRTRQPLLQIHMTKLFVVLLLLTMMASVRVL
jgi:hypothetical protein